MVTVFGEWRRTSSHSTLPWKHSSSFRPTCTCKKWLFQLNLVTVNWCVNWNICRLLFTLLVARQWILVAPYYMFVLRVRSHRSCRKSLISGSSVVEYHKGFYFVKLRIFTARRIAHSSNSDVNAISIGGPVPSRALLSIPFLSNPSPNIPPASAFWCTVVVKCMVTTDMVCCYAMQNKAGANLVAKNV